MPFASIVRCVMPPAVGGTFLVGFAALTIAELTVTPSAAAAMTSRLEVFIAFSGRVGYRAKTVSWSRCT